MVNSIFIFIWPTPASLIFIVTGLLWFYKVITFIFFITGSLYGQRLWQTLNKGGPMHQVCCSNCWIYNIHLTCFLFIQFIHLQALRYTCSVIFEMLLLTTSLAWLWRLWEFWIQRDINPVRHLQVRSRCFLVTSQLEKWSELSNRNIVNYL